MQCTHTLIALPFHPESLVDSVAIPLLIWKLVRFPWFFDVPNSTFWDSVMSWAQLRGACFITRTRWMLTKMWTRQWVEHKYGGEIWTEGDGIIHKSLVYDSYISLSILTWPAVGGWVQKLRSLHFEKLRLATCAQEDRSHAWLQAKTGFKVNLKMIQAADHVTFLRRWWAPQFTSSWTK